MWTTRYAGKRDTRDFWTQLSGFTVNLRIIYGCPPKISASLLYLLIQALDVSDVL